MGRFRVVKNSLLGGQISRNAVGRTDLPQYAHSCEILQNMIPLLSGGAYRRPGSMFQDYIPANNATLDSSGLVHQYQSAPPRLFPFIVDEKTAYAIVIGTMRWSTLGANNPAGLSGGAYMQFYRATGNTNQAVVGNIAYGVLPYRCKSQAVAATNTGECIYTRQGGPGAVANSGVMITSGATINDVADSLQSYDDDVWAVQYCQANDVMFLTHPDYQPQTIWLNAPDDIRARPFDYNLSGLALAQSRPYLNQNTTAATMTYAWSGSSATGTLTCSTAFFDKLHAPRTASGPEGAPSPINDGAFFAIPVSEGTAMTGNNTNSGILFLQVTSYISATQVNVRAINGVPSLYASGTASSAWWESAWSNYRGWPSACAIYKQRLVLAATKHQPGTMWLTATGVYGAPVSNIANATSCKFSALGDGPNQGLVTGATGTLANGQKYTTPQNWAYYPVDDAQGDGQSSGPLGAQPFRISLATTSLDAIQYLSPDQQLFVGTATQEWVCAPVSGNFDVANVECTTQSHYGSDLVQAVRIGYELMFVLNKKDEIRAYQYNYFDQSFFGEPVQIFFDEFPQSEDGPLAQSNPYAGRKKYRQIDWDSTRSTLWCIDTFGNLFGLTRDRKLAVTTWHTHQMGGFDATHGAGQNQQDNLSLGNFYTDSANYLCDGSVISACTTPNPLGGIRDLWVIVKRSYQGGSNTIWSVERMVGGNTVRQSAYSAIAPGNAQEPVYTDCTYFLTDHGDPTNFNYTVGTQLSGQTLTGTYYSQAWGMFAIGAQAAVASNGAISLQTNLPADYGDLTKAHTIVVGLGYNSIVQPVRVDPPSQVGTSQGAIKRNSKAYLRLFKTLMLKMGSPPPGRLETVRFAPSANLAQSPEIFTGDKEVFLPTGFDRDGYVYILQDQPLPFTLVSISLEGTEYEQ